MLCHHTLYFSSPLTLLRRSVARSKSSLGKSHIARENMWVIFFFSNFLWYWFLTSFHSAVRTDTLMVSIPLGHENFPPCFMSLGLLQCLLVYSLWELEWNLYPAVVWKLYRSLLYWIGSWCFSDLTIYFYFSVFSFY